MLIYMANKKSDIIHGAFDAGTGSITFTMVSHRGAHMFLLPSGEIVGIWVPPLLRGQGIATAMWHYAKRTAGVPSPKHSRARTDAGDGWAKSVGGKLPADRLVLADIA